MNNKDRLLKQLKISRDMARFLGREAVLIQRTGCYLASSDRTINIEKEISRAIQGTVSYPPDKKLPGAGRGDSSTSIEVRNETTLSAAERLIEKGFNPAALNFASATSPGGGFLNGARAQEEYLARSSALWSCLDGNEMYSFHRARRDPFYSDYVIYSPDVPILRNDDGELLEEPYPCSIITSPAVHATGVRRYMPDRLDKIGPVMWSRILKVLSVAKLHGHRAVVLGAWGCGAFGNDRDLISGLFRRALEDNFRGAFEQVVFAITDWSDDGRFIAPFERIFNDRQAG